MNILNNTKTKFKIYRYWNIVSNWIAEPETYHTLNGAKFYIRKKRNGNPNVKYTIVETTTTTKEKKWGQNV